MPKLLPAAGYAKAAVQCPGCGYRLPKGAASASRSTVARTSIAKYSTALPTAAKARRSRRCAAICARCFAALKGYPPARRKRPPRPRRNAGLAADGNRITFQERHPMEQTWRWFGPDDPVRLPQIRQAGASGIVTALHHIPYGVAWSVEEISRRRDTIAADSELGLRWSVVESLPVAEAIKLGEGDLASLFENYRQSLRNLAACGITTVCYNFMAVIDWTRTELAHRLPGGGTALRFDAVVYAAFDCYILERAGAEADYSKDVLDRARQWIARIRGGQGPSARDHHGWPARGLRSLRCSGAAPHAGALSRDRA
jgi:hypothetical protein